MSENTKRVKNGFIAGSLASSAGVFVSKLIGLFYVVPFRSIVGQQNLDYYSAAYTYYNVLLQICSAGLPFAIAAIVARYANRNDYKTLLLVRKMSTLILMCFGFGMAILFMAISRPLAAGRLGPAASPEAVIVMQNTFVILALALFFVPILYSYRGFYQGLKELNVYAASQVIEQFARVAALLGLGFLVVKVMGMAPIFGIYASVLATTVGCIFALLYFMAFDRKQVVRLKAQARHQRTKAASVGDLLLEMLGYGLPYVLVAILGNSQTLVNTQFFVRVNTSMGMSFETAQILNSIIETNCDKLTSIPQVLSIGFSAGIVPYMTTALENRDRRMLNRNIEDCLDTVLYIAMPICFTMAVLSGPIYYFMYGAKELEFGTVCLRWASLLGFMTTLTPICNSMMLTLRFRKESIIYLAVGFMVKLITFYPLIRFTGFTGSITSSVLCSLTIVILSLLKIKQQYKVRYRRIGIRAFKMLIGCFCMNGVYALFRMVGCNGLHPSRLIAMVQLAAMGISAVAVYLLVTDAMKLPKAVFHMSLKDLVLKVAHRGA
ncbi:MAG: polysaccharide biosynthesis C-terminal domain-containing protein [Solobacterium sp.]|nr:polysaccharide biosynthesis C-terminal domain-containing protein [Solobacterium sp.]